MREYKGQKVFIGQGIKYYRPRSDFIYVGSGWASNLWNSFGKPFLKSTGKVLLQAGKQALPVVANVAANAALSKIAETGKLSDSAVNTLSGLTQKGLTALDSAVNKPNKDLSKTETAASDFISSQTGKLLSNLLSKQGNGVRMSARKKLGSGIKRLGGGGLELVEAQQL